MNGASRQSSCPCACSGSGPCSSRPGRSRPRATASSMLLGVAALLAASTLASRYPVPIEGPNSGGVSLSFVFAASAIVLFGWAAGVLVAFAAPVAHPADRAPPADPHRLQRLRVRSARRRSAALLVSFIPGDGTDALIAKVGVSASTQYGINLVLISLVVAVTSRRPFFELIRSSLRWTIIVFALMASAALMLVVLWQRSPLLSAALVGPAARDRPLPALDLPRTPRDEARADRSADRARQPPPFPRPARARADRGRAERAQLQPLPRRRRRLQARQRPLRPPCRRPRALPARDDAAPERRGVPARRRRVRAPASRLRRGEAVETAGAIVERISQLGLEHIGSVTVSAGVATFPRQAPDRGELIRLADSALYWAKENGKNRVHVYRPDVVELAELQDGSRRARTARRGSGPPRAWRRRSTSATRTRAATPRASPSSPRASPRASGLDQEQIELARLAGSLHDLGKLAIPEEILRKPGPLTGPERLVLERHPQIGFRMLDSLGHRAGRRVDPAPPRALGRDAGIRTGCPGPEIPLGARIIFVVDAYDAMTSDRVYRGRLRRRTRSPSSSAAPGRSSTRPSSPRWPRSSSSRPRTELAVARRFVGRPRTPAHTRHDRVTHACAFPRYDRIGEEVVGTGPDEGAMAEKDGPPRLARAGCSRACAAVSARAS